MNKQKYLIAVVLINYNNIEDTKECIKSIAASKGNLPFVFVIDNASRDASVLKDELVFYPDLECLISNVNSGFGRANNLAIEWILKNLSTEYIFILNNDTVIEIDTLNRLATSLQNTDNSIAVATPLIKVYSNIKEIWYAGGTINYNKMVPEVNHTSLNKDFTQFASGCAMFFKTEVFKKIKGFDPFYFMYDEDVELSIRLIKLGYKILYVPEAVVYHKCQGSQTKEKNLPANQLHPYHPSLLFYLGNTIVNRRYTIKKHLTGYKKIKARTFQTIYWILKSIQYLLYGNPKAFYAAIKFLTLKTGTKSTDIYKENEKSEYFYY